MIDNSQSQGETTGAGNGAAPAAPVSSAGLPLDVAASAVGSSSDPGTADDMTPDDTAPEAARTAHATATDVAAEERDTQSDAAGRADQAAGAEAEGKAAAADEDDSASPDGIQPLETAEEEPPKKNWYILKVQSNREDSIRDGLQRRVAVAGLDKYFGEVIVPTEMVSEFKAGKKRVVRRKLYPGYIVVNMEINEDTWFLVRETPGIGDFTGSAGKPTPMLPQEVQRIVAKQEEKSDEAPKLKINFNVGDRVKINEGTFENFEGDVDAIEEASGRVTVMINIFGRSTPVELEYWQIETI